MSVIGIDFGNESCYIAVARAGGIETIANDYSLRATPSCVAFSGKTRLIGVAAKNQMVTNLRNTIYDFKRLLARNYNDRFIHSYLKDRAFRIEKIENKNTIGIRVNYLDEEHVFTPLQIVAMLFTKLKDTAETALKTKVNDCVISVPYFFTDMERKVLLDAAIIAGLNVLRLMNETTAAALAYGIYKQDLPAPEEEARNVVFVDCGHSALQVAACALHMGKLKVLSCASDPNLGGKDFDTALANYLCTVIKGIYHRDPRNNLRSYLRLLTEVEKLKKQMSVNSTSLPLNIECLIDDVDVHVDMKRCDMEQVCSNLIQRAEWTLQHCLETSGLSPEEIYAVEIIGGSTRIPALKKLIENVYGKPPSVTLNQDEAVARGCALQCAMLSPLIRIREVSITDVQNYAINVIWEDSAGSGEVEVFPPNHPVPFSKMLTFYRKQPFAIRAHYPGSVPIPDRSIGHVIVNGVKPAPDGDNQKVKVKVRINLNGILTIGPASLFEKSEQEDEDQAPERKPSGGTDEAIGGASSQNNEEEEPNNIDGGEDKVEEKKKKQCKIIELPIDYYWNEYTDRPITEYVEIEGKMAANDRQEKLRADARNALEEYVYDLRSKLSTEDQLGPFVTASDKEILCRQLEDMEAWLYEEGEQCARQTYADKLNSLKNLGDPIEALRAEYEARSSAMEEFYHALQNVQKSVDLCHNGEFILNEEDLQRIEQLIDQRASWLDKQRAILAGTPRTQTPPISAAQIRQEKTSFLDTVNPILAKKKPGKVECTQINSGCDTKDGHGDQSNTSQGSEEKVMEE